MWWNNTCFTQGKKNQGILWIRKNANSLIFWSVNPCNVTALITTTLIRFFKKSFIYSKHLDFSGLVLFWFWFVLVLGFWFFFSKRATVNHKKLSSDFKDQKLTKAKNVTPMAGSPRFTHLHVAEVLHCTGDMQAHCVFQTPPTPQQHGRGCNWSFYAGFQFVCSCTHQFALLEPLAVIHDSEFTSLVCGSTTKWRANNWNGNKSFSSWPFRILAAVGTICTSSAYLQSVFPGAGKPPECLGLYP